VRKRIEIVDPPEILLTRIDPAELSSAQIMQALEERYTAALRFFRADKSVEPDKELALVLLEKIFDGFAMPQAGRNGGAPTYPDRKLRALYRVKRKSAPSHRTKNLKQKAAELGFRAQSAKSIENLAAKGKAAGMVARIRRIQRLKHRLELLSRMGLKFERK
jgi:hypothetical protein